jgi:hypothetical protein
MLLLTIAPAIGLNTLKTGLTTSTSNILKIAAVRGSYYFVDETKLQRDNTYFDTEIEHIVDFDCFESSEACVVVGNLQAKIITQDESSFNVADDTYSFNGDDVPNSLIWMRTKAVRDSTYFLVGVSTGFGIHRWNIGITDKFGHAELKANFGGNDKFIRDIAIVPKSPFALITAIGFDGLVQLDFTQMSIKNSHSGVTSGMISPLELDPSM